MSGLSIEGERADEEKPHLILCPSTSLQTSPVCPTVVSSKSRVFCRWGHGALLGAVQVHCVCLPNPLYQPFYLLCLEKRSSQQPASSCATLLMDRPALEVQVPPFHRMQEREKREKESKSLWLAYTTCLLTSPTAVRLVQAWLWLRVVLVRAGAACRRGTGHPPGLRWGSSGKAPPEGRNPDPPGNLRAWD